MSVSKLYNGMKDTIEISRKEYEGLKETIELLQNKRVVKDLIKSLKESESKDKTIKICF